MAKKINFIEVYEDRLKQIELEIAKAVHKKNWPKVTRLRAEGKKLIEYINELRGLNNGDKRVNK